MADRIAILPPERNRFAGLSQGLQNFLAARQQTQQRQALTQFAQGQGLQVPANLPPQLLAQLILQNQKQQTQQQPFTLGPGQGRFGPTGELIAERPERIPVAKPRAGALQIAREGDGTGLATGTVFQADPQGNIKLISEVGGIGLKLAEKVKLAVTQAKEFRADPRIKNLQIIERSERGMQAALKQATSPNVKSRIASDQALGVLFQKMLDPESVVRESEFARTPEGASAINRLLAIAPQLRLGGLRLLDEDRQALVDMARTLLNGAKISANRAFDEFQTRADEIGLNKKIVFGGRKRFDILDDISINARQPQGQQQPVQFQGPQQFSPQQIEAELRRRGVIQ